MNKQRLRDMSLGFLLCLALVGSYYCGTYSSASAKEVNDSSEIGRYMLVSTEKTGDSNFLFRLDTMTGKTKSFNVFGRNWADILEVRGMTGEEWEEMKKKYKDK